MYVGNKLDACTHADTKCTSNIHFAGLILWNFTVTINHGTGKSDLNTEVTVLPMVTSYPMGCDFTPLLHGTFTSEMIIKLYVCSLS